MRGARQQARRAATPHPPPLLCPRCPSTHWGLTAPALLPAPLQVWTYLPVLTEGRQILKAEQLCLLGDGQLQGFHEGCAQEGVTVRCEPCCGKA